MSSTCFSRTKKILLHNNIIIPTKLLQTKEECDNLKLGRAALTQENQRLQGEVAELRALLTNPASFTATNQSSVPFGTVQCGPPGPISLVLGTPRRKC